MLTPLPCSEIANVDIKEIVSQLTPACAAMWWTYYQLQMSITQTFVVSLTNICRFTQVNLFPLKFTQASTSAASHCLASALQPTWKRWKMCFHHQCWLSKHLDSGDSGLMVMVRQDLVTSPSFLSTASALLSIHCSESMCAFNTYRKNTKSGVQ